MRAFPQTLFFSILKKEIFLVPGKKKTKPGDPACLLSTGQRMAWCLASAQHSCAAQTFNSQKDSNNWAGCAL
jgi:hypothetical protein